MPRYNSDPPNTFPPSTSPAPVKKVIWWLPSRYSHDPNFAHHQSPGAPKKTARRSPRNQLDTAGGVFLPAPKPGYSLAGGMLDVTRTGLGLEQVDADGAALRAVDFANQLVLIAAQYRRTADSPTDAGLPALRSGGMSLIHTGRAVAQVGEFSDCRRTPQDRAKATPSVAHWCR